ncbi:MAG: endonuclease V [Betaproteobacteria bacterium RIFCSPLOWO2_12_FULL_62_13]|nr:MAG: endonuclease V [Betaproteobacteria bacterium RIFCSPLOWO2_12_FULL_62_13]
MNAKAELRHPQHRWNLTPREAAALQDELRSKVVLQDDLGAVRLVAGTDVGFERGGTVTRAAAAVLTYPDLEFADYAIARLPTRFPYVPGLLSFREAPAVLAALDRLRLRPDLILCDGQGFAHPRRCGLASHIGILAGTPTIGAAKSRLLGEYEEPPQRRGAWRPLTHNGETIGAVLRTQANVKPIFVSCGHRVSLATAVNYVIACVTRYRLPETTRWAHRLASGPLDRFDNLPAASHNRRNTGHRSRK